MYSASADDSATVGCRFEFQNTIQWLTNSSTPDVDFRVSESPPHFASTNSSMNMHRMSSLGSMSMSMLSVTGLVP